ncbi:MAG: DUF2284 domain-containing protein [Alphaproteobacteria bacterium]|uniref:DUF2284 domain-containing protein n=1 Tax=Candidatus Nitrobium versatile TaxID=2884831 RepID=A0A953M3F8_9BACT|nr:DUF2284 domain-containing protein [Candidatus Nitrobium versatile]
MQRNKLSFLNHDPQGDGPQYLEDLATGYWFSQALFTAVESGIFPLLETGGKTAAEIASALGCMPQSLPRFLHALCALGLLHNDGGLYFTTRLSSEYLIPGKQDYQGESILWRRDLIPHWTGLGKCLKEGGRVDCKPDGEDPADRAERIRKYIRAMDCVARVKTREILPLFGGALPGGEMLDVGAGSGAVAAGFLEGTPSLRATLMDIPEVLEFTGELMRERGLEERVTLCPANILEEWPVEKGRFSLVLLSNIIHAYSEQELPALLARAAECLEPEGIMVIHDLFFEHYPEKAALFDLNMFINTYNGRIFSLKAVGEELVRQGLCLLDPVALGTDTALLIAARETESLARVRVRPEDRLIAKVRELGFQVQPLSVESIPVPGWAHLRCRFGCDRYGSPHCPPHSPTPQETRELLGGYTHALLLEGEPPTKDFQRKVLQAERDAFVAGFHKAFALWAGPCSLCDTCATEGPCRNTRDSRPSMEGAGIDVFETVRRAGFALRTLGKKDDFIKYYALLLLE